MSPDDNGSPATHAASPLTSEADTTRFGPRPELRGVPDRALWLNPTLYVALLALLGWCAGWTGYMTHTFPAWASVVCNAVADYLGFTVLHESVHRANCRNRKLNDALGWLPAAMLAFTFPVFRLSHLNHHAHTNDPSRDPDHWVSRQPRFLLPLWLVSTVANYRALTMRHHWGTTRQRLGQILFDLGLLGGTVLLALTGHGMDVVVLYWAPWLMGGMFLVYAFDYLPHYPFTSTKRYENTRIQTGRLRHYLLLGQNYHLIHHLWVSVPWFSYREVFNDLELQLRAHGARIE